MVEAVGTALSEAKSALQSGKGLRDQLEAALAEINELKQQVETSQTASRELAFVKAGIDTENGVGKLLAKTYDGELDPEAGKQFAPARRSRGQDQVGTTGHDLPYLKR